MGLVRLKISSNPSTTWRICILTCQRLLRLRSDLPCQYYNLCNECIDLDMDNELETYMVISDPLFKTQLLATINAQAVYRELGRSI